MSYIITDPSRYDIDNYTVRMCSKTKTLMLIDARDRKFGFDIVQRKFFECASSYYDDLKVKDLSLYSSEHLTKEHYVFRKGKEIFKNVLDTGMWLTAHQHADNHYTRKYIQLEGTDADKQATFYIPTLLTDEKIISALESYKCSVDSSFNYDLEFAKTFLGFLGFKYLYTHTTKRKRKLSEYSTYQKSLNDGFIQFGWSDMVTLVGNDCTKYRDAFVSSGIISCDGQYYHFEEKKKCLGFKFNSEFFHGDRDSLSVYTKFKVTSEELKYRVAKIRTKIKGKKKSKKVLKDSEYAQMQEDVITMFNSINLDEVRAAYKADPYAFYDIKDRNYPKLKKCLADEDAIHIEDLLMNIQLIQDGNYYFNVCDDFGKRFHSPLTNIKSWVRQFINHDGKKYMSIDIVNSQFAIFANVIEYPDAIRNLLANAEWKSHDGRSILGLEDILQGIEVAKTEYLEWKFVEYCKKLDMAETSEEYLEALYSDMDHFSKFTEMARGGTLYESIANILGKDRKGAKNVMMKIIFGNEFQFLRTKKKLEGEFGDVIKLSAAFNGSENDVSCVPKLLQMVESYIILPIFARFAKVKKYPAATIHDSFLILEDDYDAFVKVYKEYMAEIGLPEFVLKIEQY